MRGAGGRGGTVVNLSCVCSVCSLRWLRYRLMASEFCVPKLAFFSLRASPLPLGSTGTAPRDAIGCDGRITASRMRAMGLGSAPTRHSPAEQGSRSHRLHVPRLQPCTVARCAACPVAVHVLRDGQL